MSEEHVETRAQKPKRLRWFIMGVVLATVALIGARMIAYSPESTHYHANFQVYLNGKRFDFKGPQYYEDVAICSADREMTPKERAHLHDNKNDVVHVHDHATTWGQLFDNIGWNVSDNLIETDDGTLYQADDEKSITFVLNGKEQLTSITNRVIGDQDKLLVNFGDQNQATLTKEYDGIQNNAKVADETHDPATCAGHEEPSFSDRIKHILN